MSNMNYSRAIMDSRAYLTLTLDLKEPIEIEEFARVFAGLAGMFDDYLKLEQPEMRGMSNLYVREVRDGSIIADLVPNIPDMIGYADNVLIVLGFGSLFSSRIRNLVAGKRLEKPKKSSLDHVMDTIGAVANNNEGVATLETVELREEGEKRELVARFTSSEARSAVKTIEDQKRSLEKIEGADVPRALLTFERPAKSISGVGKRTGEKAVVESVSSKSLPVIYASDLTEAKIKSEFQTENVFQRAFVVDLNVERKNGKPVAYRLMNLHDSFDLPSDEANSSE